METMRVRQTKEIVLAEPCRRCQGRGIVSGYRHVLGGVCFGCGGARYLRIASAKEQRVLMSITRHARAPAR